jgi:hypothetical protein
MEKQKEDNDRNSKIHCSMCMNLRPKKEFYQNAAGNSLGRCKKCKFKYYKQWMKQHREALEAQRGKLFCSMFEKIKKNKEKNIEKKCCIDCKENKPVDNFYRSSGGRVSRCKPCYSKYQYVMSERRLEEKRKEMMR